MAHKPKMFKTVNGFLKHEMNHLQLSGLSEDEAERVAINRVLTQSKIDFQIEPRSNTRKELAVLLKTLDNGPEQHAFIVRSCWKYTGRRKFISASGHEVNRRLREAR